MRNNTFTFYYSVVYYIEMAEQCQEIFCCDFGSQVRCLQCTCDHVLPYLCTILQVHY